MVTAGSKSFHISSSGMALIIKKKLGLPNSIYTEGQPVIPPHQVILKRRFIQHPSFLCPWTGLFFGVVFLRGFLSIPRFWVGAKRGEPIRFGHPISGLLSSYCQWLVYLAGETSWLPPWAQRFTCVAKNGI